MAEDDMNKCRGVKLFGDENIALRAKQQSKIFNHSVYVSGGMKDVIGNNYVEGLILEYLNQSIFFQILDTKVHLNPRDMRQRSFGSIEEVN